jgi:hypothetical protein
VTLPAATMPFLVADTQTHNLMLFYVYKGNLLVKRMPSELLVKEPVYNNLRPFSLETEMKLVRMAHGCKAALVLDPSGGTGNGLGADLTAGVVKVVQGDPNPYPKPASGKRKQIAQYSAFLDRSGYLYAFVQAEDRISVARSHDVGDSWMNVLPEDFSFIPKNPNSTSTDRVDGEAPFCFYDAATDNLLVFFFYHSCLVFIKAPVSVFRDAPEAAGEALAKMKPMILVGQANKDMADRGFTAAKSVEDIKTGETPPVLSPHRVAAIKTVQGYYRVFYKDDKKKLKSLISTDNGGTWMTERQSLERQQ